MSLFINYSVNTGLSINSFRKPEATGGDIRDLALAVTQEDESVYCELDGAKDALEDGSIWVDAYEAVTQEALEMIHAAINEFEDSQA